MVCSPFVRSEVVIIQLNTGRCFENGIWVRFVVFFFLEDLLSLVVWRARGRRAERSGRIERSARLFALDCGLYFSCWEVLFQ